MIARRVVVTGRVQGVGFRWSTQHEAQRIGATGWVRNRPDGSVEAVVEGSEHVVEAMLRWLRRGPASAAVIGVEIIPVEPSGAVAFAVIG